MVRGVNSRLCSDRMYSYMLLHIPLISNAEEQALNSPTRSQYPSPWVQGNANLDWRRLLDRRECYYTGGGEDWERLCCWSRECCYQRCGGLFCCSWEPCTIDKESRSTDNVM